MEHPNTTACVPLREDLYGFVIGPATPEEKTAVVQRALESGEGEFWRKQLGEWATRMVPVELLVPEAHRDWRPLVREAIHFVVLRLSPTRLAPKIVEQMALGRELSPEARLLRFIAKVPGLQKIGQVLARNRQLDRRLRRALIKLENGIADVSLDEVAAIIRRDLRGQIDGYEIKLARRILSEASVSAVVAFTWRNPETRRRERGVFKVLKPHIASCYAEDMKILGELCRHLARKRHLSGARLSSLAETLTEIRLLLEREVDFPGEQATLATALAEYRAQPGVRVPQLIRSLSSKTITALRFEKGSKVTDAQALPRKTRVQVAERLAQVLLALPALSREKDAIFHADPHAGNLLYDKRCDEIVVLDWALTERLSRKQRKNVVMLMLMMLLRDAQGMSEAIEELCRVCGEIPQEQMRNIRSRASELLDRLPLTRIPGPLEALHLLDKIALDGLRFPAALLMFRKAAFTLEGVVKDVARRPIRLDSVVVSHASAHWKDTVASLLVLLSPRDWAALEWSLLTFGSRICVQALRGSWHRVPQLLPGADAA